MQGKLGAKRADSAICYPCIRGLATTEWRSASSYEPLQLRKDLLASAKVGDGYDFTLSLSAR